MNIFASTTRCCNAVSPFSGHQKHEEKKQRNERGRNLFQNSYVTARWNSPSESTIVTGDLLPLRATRGTSAGARTSDRALDIVEVFTAGEDDLGGTTFENADASMTVVGDTRGVGFSSRVSLRGTRRDELAFSSETSRHPKSGRPPSVACPPCRRRRWSACACRSR
jgi:hypothetical protein